MDGETLGYGRVVPGARMVWLMTHGNGGQAAQRDYVLPRLSPADALHVLEYPGYGGRGGEPSKETFNAAALAAYRALRREFPHTPVGVIGESIGSGPAAYLGSVPAPSDAMVLVVPFDTLAEVAAGEMPFLPVRLLLRDNWDNVAALGAYPGPVKIYAAPEDRVIPFERAKRLAERLPRAQFVALPGGHNEWSASERVRIER